MSLFELLFIYLNEYDKTWVYSGFTIFLSDWLFRNFMFIGFIVWNFEFWTLFSFGIIFVRGATSNSRLKKTQITNNGTWSFIYKDCFWDKVFVEMLFCCMTHHTKSLFQFLNFNRTVEEISLWFWSISLFCLGIYLYKFHKINADYHPKFCRGLLFYVAWWRKLRKKLKRKLIQIYVMKGSQVDAWVPMMKIEKFLKEFLM